MRVTPELERVMVPPLWWMMVGFRQLYGLSLVHEALPRAQAWLAASMASA